MTTKPTVGVVAAQLEPARSEITARVIANFACQHLIAATHFRDQTHLLEERFRDQPLGDFFQDIRSYCSACLMSATASLEALINELFIARNCQLRPRLIDFEKDFWGKGGIERRTILEKYQYALRLLGKDPIDEHSVVFRDAWGLIELRNALVHYKPTWDPDRQRKVDLTEVLTGKYALSPFIRGEADFVSMKSMSAGCAQWAVRTTLVFMREFDGRSSLDPHKMVGFWKLET
jgi:hypothetical protein